MTCLALKYAGDGIEPIMSNALSPRPLISDRRPWGRSELIFKNEGEAKIAAKILTVDPHSRLSLQKHEIRSEYWFIMDGCAEVAVGGGTVVLRPGETLRIPSGTVHRLGSSTGTKVLEVSTGGFDEDDVLRLEDDYGRTVGRD